MKYSREPKNNNKKNKAESKASSSSDNNTTATTKKLHRRYCLFCEQGIQQHPLFVFLANTRNSAYAVVEMSSNPFKRIHALRGGVPGFETARGIPRPVERKTLRLNLCTGPIVDRVLAKEIRKKWRQTPTRAFGLSLLTLRQFKDVTMNCCICTTGTQCKCSTATNSSSTTVAAATTT